jgi:hypothetical protein
MSPGDLDIQWWWLLAAAVLAIAELAIPGIFLVWVSVAAALTGIIVMLFAPPLAFQLAVFALLAILAVYAGRRWYDHHPIPTADPKLNDRTARLIGSHVEVAEAIRGGEGRVKVGDSVWNARGPDAEAGTRMRIVGAEGGCLHVEAEAGALPSGAPQPLLP